MITITASNVNEALPTAIMHLRDAGVKQPSRYGATVEMPSPVSTLYLNPTQRVLFNVERDANVVFNLFESLWILGGRKDVAFLEKFNQRMREFSDNGVDFHAGYGYRLRHAQGFDQIEHAINMLWENPDNRRVVLQIWDANLDLGADTKDVPCNDLIFVKIRDGKLNISVANRSNDAILGCYNVNAVQFSLIQEYMANKIGVEVGTYHQVSDSLHVYEGDLWDKLKNTSVVYANIDNLYDRNVVKVFPLGASRPDWDTDLHTFLDDPFDNKTYDVPFFEQVVKPMALAWQLHKQGYTQEAIGLLHLKDNDWHYATRAWLRRRVKNDTTILA